MTSSETRNNNNKRQHENAAEVYPSRVRLSDITPYEGAPTAEYMKGVEAISESLMRYNAVVIELGRNDAAIMRCGLESSRLFFRNQPPLSRAAGVYMYRAGTGRAIHDNNDCNSSPPCIADVFRCLGKAARAALCAIARHLRLRTDVFNHLLDDIPLPINQASSSLLVATYIHASMQTAQPSINTQFEKGFLTLISSDIPALQVCDPNGRWYLADTGLGTSSVLLLTGKALTHSTAGLRPAATYRLASHLTSTAASLGRTSFAFRLMPRSNAILDCSSISAVGHVIPHSYVPISVNQFMDELSAEDGLRNHSNSIYVEQNNQTKEVSLRSLLSDPMSGSFLEDAMAVSCGHSFGGLMLRKVVESSRCSLCHAEIETQSMIPNLALRAAASVVKHEDDRKLFHNAALRKRRKEMGDQTDLGKRINKEMEDYTSEGGQHREIQYPFSVNEKVVIKGNRRTPEKFVGKQAVITSQCLNGWYLLKITGSGESVRLQYRSLQKLSAAQTNEEKCTSEHIQTNS